MSAEEIRFPGLTDASELEIAGPERFTRPTEAFGPKDARRSDWGTPAWLFAQLHEEYGFTIDAAAHAWNAKLPRWWSIEDDGLSQDWSRERVFCNPPYGAGLMRWVSKAATSGGLAVLVVPVRTEAAWWHLWALRASEIRFIRGRVHFVLSGWTGERSRPVFASAVLVYGDGPGPRLGTLATPRVRRRTEGPMFGGAP